MLADQGESLGMIEIRNDWIILFTRNWDHNSFTISINVCPIALYAFLLPQSLAHHVYHKLPLCDDKIAWHFSVFIMYQVFLILFTHSNDPNKCQVSMTEYIFDIQLFPEWALQQYDESRLQHRVGGTFHHLPSQPQGQNFQRASQTENHPFWQ